MTKELLDAARTYLAAKDITARLRDSTSSTVDAAHIFHLQLAYENDCYIQLCKAVHAIPSAAEESARESEREDERPNSLSTPTEPPRQEVRTGWQDQLHRERLKLSEMKYNNLMYPYDSIYTAELIQCYKNYQSVAETYIKLLENEQ